MDHILWFSLLRFTSWQYVHCKTKKFPIGLSPVLNCSHMFWYPFLRRKEMLRACVCACSLPCPLFHCCSHLPQNQTSVSMVKPGKVAIFCCRRFRRLCTRNMHASGGWEWVTFPVSIVYGKHTGHYSSYDSQGNCSEAVYIKHLRVGVLI